MRAVRCHELSGPSGLRVDEVPDPAQPGAGEVLIGVRAAGVNFPDVLITQGKYQFKPDPPFVLGQSATPACSTTTSKQTRPRQTSSI